MSANKLGSRSVAAVIAAIMALSPIGSAAYAATKQPVKRSVVGTKVSPAAKVPRQINRPPSLPTIQSRRNDNSGSGKNSTVAGKANNPAQRVPSMLPSASNELRERLKEPATGKSRALKPSTGAPVASVSGSARAELSSQIKAGVAGSALNTDRLSNIRDRVAGAGQFRDRVANGGTSVMKDRIDGALASQIAGGSAAKLSDGVDDAYGLLGAALAVAGAAAEYGQLPAEAVFGGGATSGIVATGGVASAGYLGYKAGRFIDDKTGAGDPIADGWYGDKLGQTGVGEAWNNFSDTVVGYFTGDSNNSGAPSTNSGSTGAKSSDGTQTANAGAANGSSDTTSQGSSGGNGSGSGSSNATGSADSGNANSNGDQAASNNGGNGENTASNGSCSDASGGSTPCGSSNETGTNTASTDNANNGGGGKGTPNPVSDTSTRGSIIASMALDRALGGNQTRQQEKDRAARTGGGVTTPFDGAETSNVTTNLAIDRQFNTGYASRQEDHLDGKQGGNVGQPGDDVNWNRNKSAKVDLNDLNVVKAMQTGIKTPTVDQGNAGNKAPKAPTAGGGYTGGGGGTTASQVPVQGAAGVTTGSSATQSVQSAVQTRLRNAMSSAAGQVREQANTVR